METLPHEKQILEYEKTIAQFKTQNGSHPILTKDEIKKLEKKLDKLKEKVYSSLSSWDRVLVCRHPDRPRSIDFIKNICEEFVELCGDRTFGDDHAVVGGMARIGDQKFIVVGQEKGCDTESRLHRNFGMVHPEGFRKALRLAQLGEKFNLPVVFLLDTPGAYPGLSSEERGVGWAIALNLRELSRLRTPIIVVVIGEGCSGGALGMGVGDSVAMLEHSYYSVISPEGCASILWKDGGKKNIASDILRMHAEDLLEFEVIDAIIKEPLGGAHRDPKELYESVKEYILTKREVLSAYPPELLIQRRYEKFRKIGRTTTDETSSQGSAS